MDKLPPYQATTHVSMALLQQIERLLKSSVYQDIHGVECSITNEGIVLRGTVSSYYLKQAARDLVRQCIGITIQLDNQLQVKEV